MRVFPFLFGGILYMDSLEFILCVAVGVLLGVLRVVIMSIAENRWW